MNLSTRSAFVGRSATMEAADRPANGDGAGNAKVAKGKTTKVEAPYGVWSFEPIYEEYHGQIFSYLYHMVGNREQAADLTQDTFLKVFKALPTMDANLKVSPWIYRIAMHTGFDFLRRRKLIAWTPLQDMDHEPMDKDSADPQETIGTSEQVHATLRRMPPHYRAALILYTQEGFTYAEIATALDIAESGVKMYLSRARNSFRIHFRALEQGEGGER